MFSIFESNDRKIECCRSCCYKDISFSEVVDDDGCIYQSFSMFHPLSAFPAFSIAFKSFSFHVFNPISKCYRPFCFQHLISTLCILKSAILILVNGIATKVGQASPLVAYSLPFYLFLFVNRGWLVSCVLPGCADTARTPCSTPAASCPDSPKRHGVRLTALAQTVCPSRVRRIPGCGLNGGRDGFA